MTSPRRLALSPALTALGYAAEDFEAFAERVAHRCEVVALDYAPEMDAGNGDLDGGANIAALTRAVRARGKKRLVCARSQFTSPTMRVGRRPSSARRHACTTTSTGLAILNTAVARTPAPIAPMKGVSPGPGHTAATCNPRPRYLAHSASVNDGTKAYVAP